MHVVLTYINVGDKNKQCSCQVGLNKNLIVLFMYYHITVKDEQVKPVYALVPNNDTYM